MQTYAKLCKVMQSYAKSLYPIISLLHCMSDRYKVTIHGMHTNSKPMHAKSGAGQMNKVTDTLLDVTKVAVVGGVAMGLMGAAGALIKK